MLYKEQWIAQRLVKAERENATVYLQVSDGWAYKKGGWVVGRVTRRGQGGARECDSPPAGV